MSDREITIGRVLYLSKIQMIACYDLINPIFPLLAERFNNHAMRDINHNQHIMFIAKNSQGVVGVIKGFVMGPTFNNYSQIDCLCVDERYRHYGIGARLLAAYENCARTEYDASCVYLESAPAAVNFYRNRGYIGCARYLHKIFSR